MSSFVTECPYCGTRLRKRAPKLESGGLAEPGRRRARAPKLTRMRPGEIPGIQPTLAHKPVVSIALAVACTVGAVALGAFGLFEVAVVGPVDGEWWRVASAPFFFEDLWYAAACVLAIAIFGISLERRHGALAPLLLFALGGMGGIAAAAALETFPLAAGANGAALAMVAAWGMRPARELRGGQQPADDLLGAGVFLGVLLLMPLAVEEASPTTGAAGLLVGLLAGAMLARRP